MNKDRLVEAARFLRRVPQERFDLEGWTVMDGRADKDIEAGKLGELLSEDVIMSTCGMAACAVGWCGSAPKFQAQGLTMKIVPDGSAAPYYKGEMGWDAVRAFFDLGHYEAEHLFDSDKYDHEPNYEDEGVENAGKCLAKPADVADRIDEMTGVDTHGAPVLVLLT